VEDRTPLAHSTAATTARLGIGKTKLFELIKTGQLKPFKVGRKTLIPEAEIQRFITTKMAAFGDA
jgi:excisionase family DNA binding protein